MMRLTEQFFNKALYCKKCSTRKGLMFHDSFGDCEVKKHENLNLWEGIRERIGLWILPERSK